MGFLFSVKQAAHVCLRDRFDAETELNCLAKISVVRSSRLITRLPKPSLIAFLLIRNLEQMKGEGIGCKKDTDPKN